jgi:hypothetical protein
MNLEDVKIDLSLAKCQMSALVQQPCICQRQMRKKHRFGRAPPRLLRKFEGDCGITNSALQGPQISDHDHREANVG